MRQRLEMSGHDGSSRLLTRYDDGAEAALWRSELGFLNEAGRVSLGRCRQCLLSFNFVAWRDEWFGFGFGFGFKFGFWALAKALTCHCGRQRKLRWQIQIIVLPMMDWKDINKTAAKKEPGEEQCRSSFSRFKKSCTCVFARWIITRRSLCLDCHRTVVRLSVSCDRG